MTGEGGVPSDLWTEERAAAYDDPDDPMFAPDLLDRTTGLLAELAGGRPVLEFAIGTGRVAVPLHAKGVPVAGIEYSPAMAKRLRAKTDAIPVTVGDMSTTHVDGEFGLVYLVYNTIGNLVTQDAQVECFWNAARHLAPGGRFVVEVGVPSLRLMSPGQLTVPYDVSAEHVGLDEYDLVTQRAVTHHFSRTEEGTYRYTPHNYRYVWPSELDLMARLAGMTLEARYGGWDREPFTAESTSHVSVWRTDGAPH